MLTFYQVCFIILSPPLSSSLSFPSSFFNYLRVSCRQKNSFTTKFLSAYFLKEGYFLTEPQYLYQNQDINSAII